MAEERISKDLTQSALPKGQSEGPCYGSTWSTAKSSALFLKGENHHKRASGQVIQGFNSTQMQREGRLQWRGGTIGKRVDNGG